MQFLIQFIPLLTKYQSHLAHFAILLVISIFFHLLTLILSVNCFILDVQAHEDVNSNLSIKYFKQQARIRRYYLTILANIYTPKLLLTFHWLITLLYRVLSRRSVIWNIHSTLMIHGIVIQSKPAFLIFLAASTIFSLTQFMASRVKIHYSLPIKVEETILSHLIVFFDQSFKARLSCYLMSFITLS